jgi:hypothetical protein
VVTSAPAVGVAIRRVLGLLALCAFAGLAHAHKASDSYLQIDVGAPSGIAVRWDIALRDLDAALDLDGDEDGRLTWGEVKAAWPRIEAYALPRLAVAGCPLKPTGRALERRNDGAYAVLLLGSDCAAPPSFAITYTLLREVDPTHRGIAKIQRAGQPPALALLDPTRTGASTLPAAVGRVDGSDSTHVEPAGSAGFLKEGMRHILTGYDHVLFLLCLLLPSVMRRTPAGWQPVERISQAVWPVVGIVSAFTVAHSITLGLAATKVVSLPSAFIEPAIAVTIILAALDNVWPVFPVRRVIVTFVFGLVHGFGFAGVLAELDLPAARFAWALLQFNLGLEAGQLLIVVGVAALLFLLRRGALYPGLVIRGGSVAAMLVGALWLIERTANVSVLGF